MDLLIIPDGNRRWASKRLDKPISEFVEKDYDFAYEQLPIVISKVIKILKNRGENKLHFWCNSVNNFLKRKPEVIKSFFNNYLKIIEYLDNPKEVRIYLKGNLELLKENGFSEFYNKFKELEERTKTNKGFDLYYYVNYSTQDDIKRASNTSKEILNSMDEPENIDIVLRTGNYNRLSGFSLVKSPDAEIFVVPEFFPELNEERILEAIERVKKREINSGF